jgi:hypothetical protein
MNILWSLLFSHFLADFTFQTNFIARWKKENIWGVWAHVLIFLVTTFIITFTSLNDIWFKLGGMYFQGWFVVVFLCLFHLLEDQWRVWSIQEKKFPDNTLFFLFDQFVHIGFIVLVIPSIDRQPLIPVIWMQLGILFVLNTHFATILIYYLSKDLDHNAVLVVQRKYMPIIERLALAGCFFLPHVGWLVCIIAWLSFRGWIIITRQQRRSWIDMLVSYSVAIATGLAGRILYFS